MRYCAALGWLIWDGTRWGVDETGEIMRLAKRAALAIFDESAAADREASDAKQRLKQAAASEDETAVEAVQDEIDKCNKRSGKLLKWAINSQSAARLDAMVRMASTEREVVATHDQFDADPMSLNVSNGTLDLRTGALRPHDRADLMTKIAPVVYDPDATCPTWEKFLKRVLSDDPDLIEFAQRAVGYSLIADVSEQCLFFAYGTGKNGKSTFFETVRAMMGDYWLKAPTEMLMLKRNAGVPNDIARLPNRRFVVAAEIEEGQRLAESLVKDLTGGDTNVARFLHREFFEFQPAHKIWMYGNHKPVIKGTDDGIWRRVKLIPFTVFIPESERDPNLSAKLAAELPGILAWAVRGCLKWQDSGLTDPPAVRDATDGYRAEMDVLAAFLAECCVVHVSAKVPVKDIYGVYDKWCLENNERALKKREFNARLGERGFDKRPGTGNKTTWFGIGLGNEYCEAGKILGKFS